MRILVIDIAAEYGGAITILNQFIDDFKKDKENDYIVVLSTPKYKDEDNVKFLNYEWIKKSYLHRLWFDNFYTKKIIKKYKPDKVLSLQNCAVASGKVRQDVYFQNALPISDIRYSFKESKSVWIYQNIIGAFWKHSLKKADTIIVQSEWVKNALSKQWKISEKRIIIKSPKLDDIRREKVLKNNKCYKLFYPANGSIYKNHYMLLQAMIEIWESSNDTLPELYMTGTLSSLSAECQKLVNKQKYPVFFLGRLDKDHMIENYENSILVYPSLIETVGLPLLEARVLHRPIIAADLLYAHEALTNYDNCVYFDPKSTKGLVNAIKKMLEAVNK